MRQAVFALPFLLMTAASSPAQAPLQAAQTPARQVSIAEVNYALGDWRRLRAGGSFSFADYARFLILNPGWPGESTLRLNAEKAMRPGEHAPTVVSFFAKEKPETGNGWARLAEALAASGRSTEAMAAVRSAWASSDLPTTDELAISTRYWTHLTASDHERRADALLFAKKPADAQRLLSAVPASRRPAFAARIAMQTRDPAAESLYQAVIGSVTSDAGLMMDRARYLRDAGYGSSARQLFARSHSFTARPADPERFLEMALILADEAADERQWSIAYNIGRQLDDILPPGADIASQPYGFRDKYTSLTWLAATSAWSGLGRASDAVTLFDRYSRGGRSLQVQTKGHYWAGRAALAARRVAEASSYFQRASGYPELFYGQLALERIGRSVPAPGALPTLSVTPAHRTAFAANRLVQATRLLGQQGRRDEQSLFIRALAESLTSDGERVLATELAPQIYRQDLAVWVARAARNNGSAFYYRNAFPMLQASAPRDAQMWSLTHGITRQESSFDRSAISHAGARGMMQLMIPTAREQAGKMGVGFDYSRLTSDPDYNVMLGSAYFRRLLATWNGNVPLAVASYNAGAGNVRRWVNRYGDPRSGKDVLQWIEQIPFSETKGYVQRVIENSVVYDRLNPATPASTVHVSTLLGKHPPG